MRKNSERTKKLVLNLETIKSLAQADLQQLPVGGGWSAWSVTWQGGPTCTT